MSLFSVYVIIHISFVTTLMNILAYRAILKFISIIAMLLQNYEKKRKVDTILSKKQ